jgi:hypothetical protein
MYRPGGNLVVTALQELVRTSTAAKSTDAVRLLDNVPAQILESVILNPQVCFLIWPEGGKHRPLNFPVKWN